MKLSAAKADAFARKPDPGVRAVLVFGPDEGLVRERGLALVRSQGCDPSDPFRVVELDAAAVRKDPAALVDEAQALAFTGGDRVVRIRQAGDGITQAVKDYLDRASGAGALVVLEAGDLGPRSSLRKLFEQAKTAAALPCYADDERSLPGVIRGILGEFGLRAGAEAESLLVASLGSDRSVTRQELEKLALYVGDERREVTPDDVAACIGDSAASSLDTVIHAAAGGDPAALDRALGRAFSEGVQPITVLRTMARHLQRLHLARAAVDRGSSPDEAMKRLRPPVMFRQADGFRRQLRQWSPGLLGRAMDLVTEAELDCKTTGMPVEAVCGRALLRVAQAARKPGGPR